jgi:hypothetical protein
VAQSIHELKIRIQDAYESVYIQMFFYILNEINYRFEYITLHYIAHIFIVENMFPFNLN